MTRRFVPFVLVVLVSVFVAGCERKTRVDQSVTILSPTAPTASPPNVTGVSVSTPALTVTLNNCPTTIVFTATVYGTDVTQTVTWEKVGGGEFQSSGTSAVLEINTAGSYIVTARSTQNADVSGSVTVTALGNCGVSPSPPSPIPPVPVVSLTADPTSIQVGQSSVLNWTSQNANSCTRSGGWSGASSLSGNLTVSPSQTTSYTVSCTGPGGQATAATTITVFAAPPPPPSPPPPPAATCPVTANPMSIPQGGTTTLSWSSANATSITASGGWSGSLALSGSRSVVLSGTTTFTINCNGPGGPGQSSVTVTVTAPACPTSIDYSPKGGTIAANQNRALKVDNWPSSQCMPFWYLDRPSLAQITGADTVIVIDGRTYYAGVNAVLRGVYPGLRLNIPGVSQTYTPKKK